MCSVSGAECCVLPDPIERTVTASPFYRHKEGQCTCTGGGEVIVFSPNREGAVVGHCEKYTVGYGAWRGHRPGRRPWPCGDRAGVLVVPASGVVAAVEGTVLQAWRGDVPRVLQAKVLSRTRRSRFRGSCPCHPRAPGREKFEGGMRSWQHSGWSSAEDVSHCVTGSHSITTASGSDDVRPPPAQWL